MAFIPHAGSAEKGTPHSRVTFLIGAVNEAAPGIAAVAAGFANLTAIGMRTAAEMTSGMRVVEAGFMAVGAAAALALGVATAEAAKFEKQIKMVQAVSNDMTNQQVTAMSNQIKALSIKYGEAPAETAEAMQTLGRAGIKDATAQMAIFESAMKMAKIEGMDLADALDAVVKTTALFGSNMEDSAQFAKDAAKMTEYMVHASQISPTDVADIQQGLTYVGGAAKEVGWSPQQTMSAIAYMAQKGVSGSIAGTSIRGLLTKSVADQPKYQEAAARLGLDPGFAWTKDASGREVARPLWEIVAMVRGAAKAKGMGEREQFELWNAIGMQKTAQQMLKINPEELKAFDEEMQKSFDLQAKVDKAMEAASVKWDRFTAAVTVLAINIGEKLLPIVGIILDKLAAFAGWIAQSSVATTAFAMLLGGGVIVGAIVVLRWLSVAARWVWTEFMAISRSAGGLSGYLAGLMGSSEAAATGQMGLAGATQAATVAIQEQNMALEMNRALQGTRMYPGPIGPNPFGTPTRMYPAPIGPQPTAKTRINNKISGMGGLRGIGSSAWSMMGGPIGAALIGGLAVGFVASTIQDTKNVATHNTEAMKNANTLVEGYTNKVKKLKDEKSRLTIEQTKYNKSSEEWADLQRKITAKEGEITYMEGKRAKAQEKVAKNEEEIARWTENSTAAYQNMLIAMDQTPIPKPGVTAPTIPVEPGTPRAQGITDISTRPYKTQATVWDKFTTTIDKRRNWIETSNDPMARFYRSEQGAQWNTKIEEDKQKETELWLRTMGIDPATGKPFEAGQYGVTDWLTDYTKLGVAKLTTHVDATNAGINAQSYDLDTGKKKGWWEQWFGVKPQQSVGQVNQTTNKVNSLFKNSNSSMLSGWSATLSGMNSKTALFNTTTKTNMQGASGSVLSNVGIINTGLFGMQGSIASAIGWFDLLWAAARGGVVGAAAQVLSTAFQGSFKVGTTAALATATASGNQGTIQKTQQAASQPFFNIGPQSPVRIWNKGTPRYAAGAIEFPDLNPDLFKKRAVETGEALGAGKGGGVQIGTLIVNANTKSDAKYIAEAVRAEIKKVAESV